MARIEAVPATYEVFNHFDRQGLLLSLQRIRGENNADYKQRLMDVLVNAANATYRGLINGITRELGLKIQEVMTIVPNADIDGNLLLPQPSVDFQGTKCFLYSDIEQGTLVTTLDRFDLSSTSFSLQGLVADINATGYWTATLKPDANPDQRSMTIFNQSSVEQVTEEDISGKGARIVLDNNDLLEGTFTVQSDNLTSRKTTLEAVRRKGDYFVDLANGIVYAAETPASGTTVRYKYRQREFLVLNSPVIIHDLQSDDFKTKMFEQVCDIVGDECNGLPTPLGADIINELLSVFPSNWGK